MFRLRLNYIPYDLWDSVMKILFVFLFGVIVGTIGLDVTLGLAKNGVAKVQEAAKDAAKDYK